MKKLITYSCLFMAMLDCFVLGMYTYGILTETKKVETYQWVLTISFGVWFLLLFFINYDKLYKRVE